MADEEDQDDKKIDNIDFYAVLGLSPDWTDKAIRRSYREIARMTHPDKNRGNIDTFIDAHNAYKYLDNPTTRLIYDSFGHSGLQEYENFIPSFEDLEAEHKVLKQSGDDCSEIEQKIFDKTSLLIANTLRWRIHSEYELQTNFELGFDFEKFCNYYYDYQKYGKSGFWSDDSNIFGCVGYRQAVMTSAFKIPIASWISGEVSVSTHTDMRRNIGYSKISYKNNIDFSNGVSMSNTMNLASNDFNIVNELSTNILNNAISVGVSWQSDANGTTKPHLSAGTSIQNIHSIRYGLDLEEGTYSTVLGTKVGRYSLGSTFRVGERLLSVSPSIKFKVYDDTTFQGSCSLK